MLFIGFNENGKKGGMVSKIIEHRPSEFISIVHYGLIHEGVEIITGQQVKKWAGGYENYTFNEQRGITTVTVDMNAAEDFIGFFNKTYPIALNQLKIISENLK